MRWDYPYFQHAWRKTYGRDIRKATWEEVAEWFLWLIAESEVAGSDPEQEEKGRHDREVRRAVWARLLNGSEDISASVGPAIEVKTRGNETVTVRMRDASSFNHAIMAKIKAAKEGAESR